jgi:hypothetical protein
LGEGEALSKQQVGDEGKIDYTLAITYAFKDPKWLKKIFIGGVLFALSLFIIPTFLMTGYVVRTIRRVASGEEFGLPEWNNLGELLRDGFKLTVTEILYLTPFIFLSLLTAFYPFLLMHFAASERFGSIVLISILRIPLQMLMMLTGVLIGVWLISVEIAFATEGNVQSCFHFKNLYQFIKNNLKDYLFIYLVVFGLGYLGSIGILLFIIGFFFTSFYVQLVKAHLEGQLIRKSYGEAAKLRLSLPVKKSINKAKEVIWLGFGSFVLGLLILAPILISGSLIYAQIRAAETRALLHREIGLANSNLSEAVKVYNNASEMIDTAINTLAQNDLSKRNAKELQRQFEAYARNIGVVIEKVESAQSKLEMVERRKVSKSYKKYIALKKESLKFSLLFHESEKLWGTRWAEAYRAYSTGNEEEFPLLAERA